MKTIELLLKLLTCQSITPDDAGCMDILAKYLSTNNFCIESVNFNKVKNFWAYHGSSSPLTVLAGHTDVVPVGDDRLWQSPPFIPTERNGYLYARGSADMKTGVAAMCVAAVEFIKSNPNYKGSIAIMLTSDEEGQAQDGIRKFMPYLVDKGVKIDYAVFTEPTSVEVLGDTIKNGRRGSMHAHLKIFGKQGHIAYPDNAANPIHVLGSIITALSQEVWCQGNNNFPATSKQIWSINGGVNGANNIIPGQVSMSFNFRFSNELTSQNIKNRVENIIQNELKKHMTATGKKYNYQISYDVSGEPFLTLDGKLVNAMRDACIEVLQVTPNLSTDGGTSDARFVAPFGVQVVEFGPINATIHQVNECVKIADIEPLMHTYKRLLEKLHD